MPRFMGVHNARGATGEAVADAHKKDLAAQEKHGVKYLRYWHDEQAERSSACARRRARKRQSGCAARLTA